VIADRLEPTIGETCQAAGKRPHIIMVHDESSFDITAAPGIRIPPDYRRHFESFNGRIRSFAVEGVGGPSWYASTGHTSTQPISLQRIQLFCQERIRACPQLSRMIAATNWTAARKFRASLS
jgi:hypothetical protein